MHFLCFLNLLLPLSYVTSYRLLFVLFLLVYLVFYRANFFHICLLLSRYHNDTLHSAILDNHVVILSTYSLLLLYIVPHKIYHTDHIFSVALLSLLLPSLPLSFHILLGLYRSDTFFSIFVTPSFFITFYYTSTSSLCLVTKQLLINFKKRNANIELTGDIYAIIQGGAVKFNPQLQKEQIFTEQENDGKAKKYFKGVELTDNDEIIVYLEAQPKQETMQKANI